MPRPLRALHLRRLRDMPVVDRRCGGGRRVCVGSGDVLAQHVKTGAHHDRESERAPATEIETYILQKDRSAPIIPGGLEYHTIGVVYYARRMLGRCSYQRPVFDLQLDPLPSYEVGIKLGPIESQTNRLSRGGRAIARARACDGGETEKDNGSGSKTKRSRSRERDRSRRRRRAVQQFDLQTFKSRKRSKEKSKEGVAIILALIKI